MSELLRHHPFMLTGLLGSSVPTLLPKSLPFHLAGWQSCQLEHSPEKVSKGQSSDPQVRWS